MPQWEYTYIAVSLDSLPDGSRARMTYGPSTAGTLADTLAQLGKLGWELTGVDSSAGEAPGSIYIFKRPLR